MGTRTKLYTDTRQTVPPNTWYNVEFDVVIQDDGGWAHGPGQIRPHANCDMIWSRKVWFDQAAPYPAVPEGVQFNTRFTRNPFTDPDNTGETDKNVTPGKTLCVDTWQFAGKAGQPVGVQVRHNHTEPIDIVHAQFVATTWDF